MKHFGQIFPRLILFIVVIILSASAINAQDRDQEGLNGTVGGLLKASDYKYQKTAEFVWKLEHDGETIMVGAAGNLFRASIFIIEAVQSDFFCQGRNK